MWMHPSIYPPLHVPPTSLSSSPASSAHPLHDSVKEMPTGKLNLNGPATTPWGLVPPHHLPMDEGVAGVVKEETNSGNEMGFKLGISI
jgi:hypothetical protein